MSKSFKKPRSLVTTMFISLVFVTTLTTLANTITGLVDGLAIQRLTFSHDLATSGYSLTSPYTQLIYGIAQMIAIGSQILITKSLASGKSANAKKTFQLSFVFALLLGVVLCIFGTAGSNFITLILGGTKAGNQQITEACSKYILGYSIGLPFLFIDELLMPIVYIDNDKKTASLSIIFTIGVNAGLDILLTKIFGTTFGVGLAISCGYFASSFILFTHFLRKKSTFRVSFKNISFKETPKILATGSSTFIKNLVITSRVFILNFLIIAICNRAVIAPSVVLTARGVEGTVSNLFCCGVGGLISTVITLGAMFYNEEDEGSLNELIKLMMRFIILIGGSLTIAYFFSAEAIAKNIFKLGGNELKQATIAMKCESLTIMFSSFNTAMLAFFQGSKKYGWAYFCTFMQSFCLQITFVSILGFTIGIHGIWVGTALGFISYPIIHLTIATIRAKRLPKNCRDLFFLSEDFGYRQDRMIEFTILNVEDCLRLARTVLEYVDSWGVDTRKRNHVASCVEELALFTVLSGFSKEHKKCQLNIRVLYKDKEDKLTIRTRDNCKELDLKKINEKLNDPDPTKNLSLRLVMKMATHVNYNRVLKTNNLIIKF